MYSFEAAAEAGGAQYLLVGNPAQATVKITPRSLNQSSKGQWVTVKISGLPEGYIVGDINLGDVCVTGSRHRLHNRTCLPGQWSFEQPQQKEGDA